MNNGIYTALSGAVAQEKRLNTISNNIANVNTTAFKGDSLAFEAYMPKGDEVSNNLTDNVNRGNIPVGISVSATDYSQGSMVQTGRDMDIAIEGKGFFVVDTPEGYMYTRNGRFKEGEDGLIETLDGHPLIGEDGYQMRGMVPEKIALVDFEGGYTLSKLKGGLYRLEGNGVELVKSTAGLRQGFLEQSNVNSVKEMTKMISATRGYESYQKVIQSFDEVSRKIVNEVGRGL